MQKKFVAQKKSARAENFAKKNAPRVQKFLQKKSARAENFCKKKCAVLKFLRKKMRRACKNFSKKFRAKNFSKIAHPPKPPSRPSSIRPPKSRMA